MKALGAKMKLLFKASIVSFIFSSCAIKADALDGVSGQGQQPPPAPIQQQPPTTPPQQPAPPQQPKKEDTTSTASVESLVITSANSDDRWIVSIRSTVIEKAMPALEPIRPGSEMSEKLNQKARELENKFISDFCFERRSDFLTRGLYYKKIAENTYYVIGPTFGRKILLSFATIDIPALSTEIYNIRRPTYAEQIEYEPIIIPLTSKNARLKDLIGRTYRDASEIIRDRAELRIIELDERVLPDEKLLIANPNRINLVIKNGVIVSANSDLERR